MTRRLLPILLAAAFLLPATATAMPIDNGPAPQVRHTSPPPSTRTIVETSHDGERLAIVLAGIALLLAGATATYTVVRLPRAAPLRQ
jgi:hypothetical protein